MANNALHSYRRVLRHEARNSRASRQILDAIELGRQVAKQIDKGIELLTDIQGVGVEAKKGDTVTYNARFFLRRGDEVTWDSQSIALYRSRLDIRSIDGVELIDHKTLLGKRRLIAGVEKSLYGIQRGGYREVLVSAHLAYGDKGIENMVPPNAMLRIQLWVQHVRPAT